MEALGSSWMVRIPVPCLRVLRVARVRVDTLGLLMLYIRHDYCTSNPPHADGVVSSR